MLDCEPSNSSGEGCDGTEGAPEHGPAYDDVGEWFEREILPHRASLERYLSRCFPHETDLDDIVQQSFERILARSGDDPIDNPKFYLRRTAWSLIQSRVRRRAIASIDHYADLSAFEFRCDAPLPDDVCAAREELALLSAHYSKLCPRTQEAIRLVRIEDRPFLEAAAALDISVSGVAKRIRTAVRQLRSSLEADGVVRHRAARIPENC